MGEKGWPNSSVWLSVFMLSTMPMGGNWDLTWRYYGRDCPVSANKKNKRSQAGSALGALPAGDVFLADGARCRR